MVSYTSIVVKLDWKLLFSPSRCSQGLILAVWSLGDYSCSTCDQTEHNWNPNSRRWAVQANGWRLQIRANFSSYVRYNVIRSSVLNGNNTKQKEGLRPILTYFKISIPLSRIFHLPQLRSTKARMLTDFCFLTPNKGKKTFIPNLLEY